MFQKLDDVESKYEQIQLRLQEPGIANDQKRYTQLLKDMASIEPVVEEYRSYKKNKKDLEDNRKMLAEEKDEDMRSMAKEEISDLEKQLESSEQKLKILLIPKDPNDERNVILEIRAGAGGDEASLFSEELFRSYSLFASKQGWRVQLMSTSPGNVGGLKEVIASISGDKVYSKMKYESGVHRVQRVPKTEAAGRVHTSTITVAVLPEVDEMDEIKIEAKDIKVDVFRAQGAGGQSVNRTESAVRITHLPTNTVVVCQDGKSQQSNREQAMKVLASRLMADQVQKAQKEASDQRLSQIGTGDRSERIRTYNFPQSRVTDHRIGLTVHQIGEIMNGGVDIIIEPLATHFQSEALKQQIS